VIRFGCLRANEIRDSIDKALSHVFSRKWPWHGAIRGGSAEYPAICLHYLPETVSAMTASYFPGGTEGEEQNEAESVNGRWLRIHCRGAGVVAGRGGLRAMPAMRELGKKRCDRNSDYA
jgi:hypothetical protein